MKKMAQQLNKVSLALFFFLLFSFEVEGMESLQRAQGAEPLPNLPREVKEWNRKAWQSSCRLKTERAAEIVWTRIAGGDLICSLNIRELL